MEVLSILLVLNLLLISVVIVLILKKKDKSITNVYTGIENMEDDEYFSKAVKRYYLDVISEPNMYICDRTTLKRTGQTESSSITIWAANDISDRRFYTHSGSKREEVKSLNSKLTSHDLVLLDKLCKAIADRNIKIEEKIFF